MLCIGMLWFDDSSQPFGEKLARAAAHYRSKHGCSPNVCYVHPSNLNDKAPTPEAIRIVRMDNLLPNHFWLGVAEHKLTGYRPARSAA